MHPIQNALAKFWAPVPWLLEAAIVLQVVLHKYIEAAVIGGLLIFNAALAAIQEGRTQATLDALKSRLALNASVKRDGIKLVGGIPGSNLRRFRSVRGRRSVSIPRGWFLPGSSFFARLCTRPGL
jgi:hypothetical protein